MALNRVASIESWDRSSLDQSPDLFAPRKMSFNPIDNIIPPAQPKVLKPAAETSEVKRIVQIVVACIYCLLAAGVVFGFAAFKPVLVKQGVYNKHCKPADPSAGQETCVAQEIRLNLMFTTAAVATNIVALPVGTLLDKYGPRVCSIIGALLLALGSSFISLVPFIPFDGYLPGYLCLALGGPFIYISSFQLSNCFPRHSGLILALLTGAFDASSSLLLIYRIIYDASGDSFTPQHFFTIYLVTPVFILLAQLFIMPRQSYKTMGETAVGGENNSNGDLVQAPNVVDETTPLTGNQDIARTRDQEDRKRRITGVWGVLHGLSARQQIATPWWILVAMFTTIQMTRINYFLATIRTQYTSLFGSYDKAKQINHFFDIALPAGGIVAIPFIGLILDNLSTPAAMGVLVGAATLIGILGIIPNMAAAYIHVILFTLYRPLYYTGVSDYSAKVFGFQTFGKVYGLIICIAGLFNFVQSGLDALTHGPFGDDPKPVNLMLLLTGLVIGASLVIYVQQQKQKLEKSRSEVDP